MAHIVKALAHFKKLHALRYRFTEELVFYDVQVWHHIDDMELSIRRSHEWMFRRQMHVQTIVPSLKLLSFKQFFFGRVFLGNTTRFVFRVGHRLLADDKLDVWLR